MYCGNYYYGLRNLAHSFHKNKQTSQVTNSIPFTMKKKKITFKVVFLVSAIVGSFTNLLFAQSTNCVGETGQGAYYSGVYRNMFKELLNKTDTEVNNKVNAAFQHFFYGSSNQKLYYEVGSDMAYILDVANNDVRSEGMSYGLMICVQLDKKAEFDKLWKWTKTYMHHNSGNLDGFFRWQLNTSGSAIDNNPAPDGEAYFVTALFFAANRWGNGTGIYNYAAEAQSVLSKVQSKTGAGGINSLFNKNSNLITFGPNGGSYDFTDPSYNLPGFFELWGRWSTSNKTFWQQTPAAARKLLRDASHSTSGLSADYSNFDGTPKTTSFNTNSHRFMYDAWRTIMNIGMDYHWFRSDAQQPVVAARYLTFFKNQGSGYKNHYDWNGSNAGGDHSTGLVACNAVGALAVSDVALTTPFVQEFWNIALPSGQYRYYDGMLYMLSMLNVTGKFQVWQPCSANPAPTVTLTSPANNATFAVGATVNLTATASDANGTVSKVEFYAGNTKLEQISTAPYTYSWTNVAEGLYTLTAVATDNAGATTTSSPISIMVGTPTINLVRNGEFDNGTTDWTLQLNNSTTGTMTQSTTAAMSGTNSLRICPTSAGDADWNVQVSQTVGIISGKIYEISYMAKSDAARTITTAIQEAADPYTTYLAEQVSLTTTSQLFTHTLTANTADATALIKFFVGNNTSCVNIDKVVMRETTVLSLENNAESQSQKVTVYPNPFHSQLTIKAKGNFSYQLMNQLGQIVENGNGDHVVSIENNLEKGVYFLTVETALEKKTHKIIKE